MAALASIRGRLLALSEVLAETADPYLLARMVDLAESVAAIPSEPTPRLDRLVLSRENTVLAGREQKPLRTVLWEGDESEAHQDADWPELLRLDNPATFALGSRFGTANPLPRRLDPWTVSQRVRLIVLGDYIALTVVLRDTTAGVLWLAEPGRSGVGPARRLRKVAASIDAYAVAYADHLPLAADFYLRDLDLLAARVSADRAATAVPVSRPIRLRST